MDDKELLEFSAKAIKKDLSQYQWIEPHFYYPTGGFFMALGDGSHFWNPIADDGDAFRLASKLSMDIFIHQISVAVAYGDLVYRLPCEKDNRTEVARKAIVMAAADIGRNMT